MFNGNYLCLYFMFYSKGLNMKNFKAEMLKQKEAEMKAQGATFAQFISGKAISLNDIFEFMEAHGISQIQDIFGHYVVFHKKDMKNANV